MVRRYSSPIARIAAACDVVFTSLPTPADVRAVGTGEAGAVVIELGVLSEQRPEPGGVAADESGIEEHLVHEESDASDVQVH